jgi:CheY-like chemotaxis protein
VAAAVIAASNLISSLCEQLSSEGELFTFADTEAIQALQAILERQPELIVLERLFAATPRGAALINRIKMDPELAHTEIRVMSHSGDYTRQITRPAPSTTAQPPSSAAPSPPKAPGSSPAAGRAAADAAAGDAGGRLDWYGTRRAPRHRLKPGVEIQLDGSPASVVDLSTAGAQVLSATILRPNQKVRVTIPQDDTLVRCRGAVAWAKFELPSPTAAPLYRAGVEFLDADRHFIEQFAARNRS